MTKETKQEKDNIEVWLGKVERITYFFKAAFVYAGSTLGLFAAGLTPAITFSYSLYKTLTSTDLAEMAWNKYVAMGAGFSLAIVLEAIGSVSAYVWQNSTDPVHKQRAGASLIVYTALGIGYLLVEWWFGSLNSTIAGIGTIAYIVSFLMYVIVPLFNATVEANKKAKQAEVQSSQHALQTDLETRGAQQIANEERLEREKQERIWKREDTLRHEQMAHNERLQQLAIKAQLDLEKVKAKKEMESSRKDSDKLPTTYQEVYTDYRLVPEQVKPTFLTLTVKEIADLYNLSRKTAGNWKAKATKKFSQLSANGDGSNGHN
jgi:hypothetical protein